MTDSADPRPIEERLGLSENWRRAFARVEERVGGRIVAAEPQERWRPAWFLEVQRPDGERLPIYFRGDRGETDHGVYPLEHELRVLQILEARGIPVPHVYGFCSDPRGIVMERCPGRANLLTADDEEERTRVLEHYVEILADVHRIPLDAFDALGLHAPSDPAALAFGDFPGWERSFRARKNRPEPLIEFVIGWLRRNVPAGRTRASCVLGDSGQFLFERGRVTAVLDLELAYLGDPLADLAGMRCRDLSEPLGDLSHAFAHYAHAIGEEVDLPVVHYHTVRFGVCTPMAVAPLCAAPPPGLNLAQYLGWNLVYGRIPLELIAELGGFALEPPELPERKGRAVDPASDALVSLLSMESDDERPYGVDAALRLAEYLRERDRHGARLAEQNRDDVAKLLGRRIDDDREADLALERLIDQSGPERDADLARLFHRRTLRHEALLRPALRELEHAELQRIRA